MDTFPVLNLPETRGSLASTYKGPGGGELNVVSICKNRQFMELHLLLDF